MLQSTSETGHRFAELNGNAVFLHTYLQIKHDRQL